MNGLIIQRNNLSQARPLLVLVFIIIMVFCRNALPSTDHTIVELSSNSTINLIDIYSNYNRGVLYSVPTYLGFDDVIARHKEAQLKSSIDNFKTIATEITPITNFEQNTSYQNTDPTKENLESLKVTSTSANPETPSTRCNAPSFADIVEPLMPAVVNIYTVHYKKNQPFINTPKTETFPFDRFRDFFEQFNNSLNIEEMYTDPKAVSLGSGFIIDPSGYIVTNHHVVNNADEINVKLMDNTELPARIIGSDQRTDLALLKITAKHQLPFVKFGDSNKARVGDWLISIGNPFGLGGTVTTGIISAKARDIDLHTSENNAVDDYIQTDAAINSGNSGGPIFNLNGEVIGISTVIYSPSGANIGIGFAIPSNTAQLIVNQLKTKGKITRGKLDITIQEVTSNIAEGFGLKEATGVLVASVASGGAADEAGIKSGDVIIEFANKPVKNSRKLQVMVAEAEVEKILPIVVLRNDKKLTFNIKISDKEKTGNTKSSQSEEEKAQDSLNSITRNNLTFSEINIELCAKYGLKQINQGVLITEIAKNAKNYGLKVGDVVIALNKSPVNSIKDVIKSFDSAILLKKQHIVMLVKRQNMDIFIAMPLE